MRNIVFDLGNVLFKFDPEEILDDLFKDPLIKRKLKEAVFTTIIWKELDRGTLSFEEAKKIFNEKNPDLKEEINILLKEWKNYLHPITENIEILPKLKENNKLFILSNFHEDAFNYIREKYSFFDIFDGMVISYKEKLLKPEKEIYQLLLNRFNLKPEETIFVDDIVENIQAAEELGIKGILYKDPESLRELFKREGAL
ncbi:HAD family hydrolase [Petrotoga olearia]|uniref:Haloacid dehalogenase n=2 Tax=Petrotoga olearia TaxID=156203 RepID=A0A2K1P0J7_9BACT|nr:HAD family phosphatase [Petrotoga olearia]PNR96315.1 haloacid dehalogenase [Petrotoga olearia DSM 13574]RMA76658.1 putative hydrolase of the HAD superfamily [Petrotoga olearia]